MNLLQSLERISFKKLVGYSFLAVIALAVPISVWVGQQKTQLAGRAEFEKPSVIKPIKKHGPPSEGTPRIALVWPFLGKIGDAVLIEGENFGQNPKDKQLLINNQIVPEDDINQWTPELIEFLIPKAALSGTISLQVARKKASWPYLFTVYSLQTKIQVTEKNDIVKVINASPETKMEIFFSDGEKMESDQLDGTSIPSDKTIISVAVKDKSGKPIPFFVEPSEFGF